MKKHALLIMVLCALSGCGIKPGEVSPPEDLKNDEFPRTYPNIITSPPPHVPPVL